ncbi:MAG: glycoside hydrolase family protein [Desulfovibrionaceae bacterium]|nr:glycoside hydrolase family protein [Desulfovibrionaceae bacterium]MBF0514841.1 glycoside hydrolase family protein [Desulfovibrionaceae bacterium]
MDADIKAKTAALIEADEGCKLVAFLDSRGFWTIGRGYNLQAHGFTVAAASKVVWSQEQADFIFNSCLADAIHSLDVQFPDWTSLAPARQAVAVSAMYQLGTAKVMEFAPTIALIREGNFEAAAAHMEASAWGHQCRERVQRLAAMMRTGEWPDA